MIRCVLLTALAACAAAPPREAHPFHGDGFSVTFPAEPAARRAHEGPLARAHIASAVFDGCIHEAAVFDFPRALDEAEQARLLARVEHGLGARIDAREVVQRRMKKGVLELTIELADDRTGTWRIFYVGGERMVQLSVLGPHAAVAAHSPVFFASYRNR